MFDWKNNEELLKFKMMISKFDKKKTKECPTCGFKRYHEKCIDYLVNISLLDHKECTSSECLKEDLIFLRNDGIISSMGFNMERYGVFVKNSKGSIEMEKIPRELYLKVP